MVTAIGFQSSLGVLVLGLLLVMTSSSAGALRVGFAERDITPDISRPVYIAGYGENRVATGVHDPLHARAVVLADGERKIALVCVDVVGLQLPEVRRVREKLTDFHYVMVSSTHNHEGPDVIGIWGPTPIKSGVDPKRDPKGFRAAGENAVRSIRLNTQERENPPSPAPPQ